MLNKLNPTIAIVDIQALPIDPGPTPCLPVYDDRYL